MARKLFVVFLCMVTLTLAGGCMQGKPDTPEEIIAELYSGKLKNVDDIKAITLSCPCFVHAKDDPYIQSDTTYRGDEVYRALGYKSRNDYQNVTINKLLNIDHAENLNVVALNEVLYRVNGTIHFKDGTTEYLHDKIVDVWEQDNYSKSEIGQFIEEKLSMIFPDLYGHKYQVNLDPFITQIGKISYTTFQDDNKLFDIKLEAYYQGDSIFCIAYFENLTNSQFILADWPNGANIIWEGQSDKLIKPVIINSKDNPIGTTKDGEKYHATIGFLLPLGKFVYLDEAIDMLIKDNSKLTINYYIRGENGLPSLSAKKHSFNFEWGDGDWKYANGKKIYHYNH